MNNNTFILLLVLFYFIRAYFSIIYKCCYARLTLSKSYTHYNVQYKVRVICVLYSYYYNLILLMK